MEGEEMNVENPIPGAIAPLIGRQPTCSACHQVGHTRRNRNCPNYQAPVANPVVPVAAGNVGQNPVPVVVVEVANLEDVIVGLEGLEFMGGQEPNVEDHPEDLQEIDQPPAVDLAAVLAGVVAVEWPEAPMGPLPVGILPHEANIPPFIREERVGRPNDANLFGLQLLRESDFANLFIDNIVVQQWVTATNEFGRQYVRGWVRGGAAKWDTNLIEFRAFLATINLTGILQWPSRDEMFRRGVREFPFLHRIMTKKRFSTLLIAWHYVSVANYHNMEAEEQAAFRRAHPFYQVEPLVELLQARFRRFYEPGQLVDIDEQCIPWKGRHRCRCYNPKKPVKWHFKVFSLNDSSSGYCSNFYFYEGKAETRPPGMEATVFPFYRLFTNPGGELPDQYRNKNHILATDNWFTSVQAMDRVVASGNHLLGTVKANRSGIELYNERMLAIDYYN
jgi:hypothetical protein